MYIMHITHINQMYCSKETEKKTILAIPVIFFSTVLRL